ncbi:MAG: hypothetical protein RMJ98_13770 [Myxococcales bacterium]|nr:hypothetical protein [Polyangiaceae bacterium]MDW8250359.1 hypothetical protein [Myxococcales bacterium]
MGTEAINKSNGISSIYYAGQNFPGNATMMSPEDILQYVSKALEDIGGQLEDYKNIVKDRQEKAKDLRALASTIRDMQQNGDLKSYDSAKYNEFMTTMAKYKDSDPDVAKAYHHFLDSYGGYIDTNTGKKVGILANEDGHWIGKSGKGDNQDMCMNAEELGRVLKNIEDAQSNLQSDNELTMMTLQQLLQRRNQISQFSSNAMNMMNEGMKSIIGNIR